MFHQPSTINTRRVPALERSTIREETSENMRNETILLNLRKTLSEDRRFITRHPILKHLFLRYEAILNDHTVFGHPKARVEPPAEFSERVNNLSVELANKETIRRKKLAAREVKRATANKIKNKGKEQYARTNQRY